MKKIAILQSNYIPWKGYFDLINMVDEFVIYDSVQYTKNDWRNRNKIKTPNGLLWLTIPVKHRFLGQKINETEIADNKWNRKHWEALKTNYSKTVYFRQSADEWENFFLSANSQFLSDINLRFIEHIAAFLGITTKIIDDRLFSLKSTDPSEKLLEIIKKQEASLYISGPSAKNYLNEKIFHEEKVSIEWMDYSGYPQYTQQHPPFEHGVSMLDLIFNEGNNARLYMKSFAE